MSDQSLRDKLADQALVKEVYENGGFLDKPYSRYRFHAGFCKGYDTLAPQLKIALEALERIASESKHYTDALIASEALARIKALGGV